MSSIIEGYNYDIFISYRQKDNKHDGWVTEFVDRLKGELESTFKEDISIYFDENPNDGLLEIYSVDKSLEGKLHCLIFIPIISQTYCDPKSYAWRHEFCAFNSLAKEDKFGRDIKLASGNVASRILPVKIHDLDPEDRSLLENELGEALRSIEFIYKESGVNRPLKPNDDPKENLNKTHYINQVNKVANAVKEIITVLKKHGQPDVRTSGEPARFKSSPRKVLDEKNVVLSFLIFTLVILGIIFIPKLFESQEKLEKSIAILPFINESPVDSNKYFINGIMEEILNNLQTIKDFRVLSRTSTDQFQGQDKPTIPEIAKKLGVNYIIEGSGQKYGNTFRLRVQLIKAKGKETHLWSKSFEQQIKETADLFSLQNQIAQSIADELRTKLTPGEKQLINKVPTKSLEAYDLYLKGRDFWKKRTREGLLKSIDYFSGAIKEDPEFALANSGLADAYYILAWWGWLPRQEGYSLAKNYAIKALNIDKNLADAHATFGSLLCWSDWNWKEAEKELKLAIELNPNCANAYQYYSELLDITRNNKEARLQIDKALRLDPFSTGVNASSALYYFNEGKFSESLNANNKILEINPEFIQAYILNFEIYLRQGEDLKAADALQQYVLGDSSTAPVAGMLKEVFNNYGKTGLLNGVIEWQKNNPAAGLYVAKFYTMLGMKKEALECLRKILDAHSSDIRIPENFPDDIPRINNSPSFESLRNEPEFQAILEKMGLSGYQ